MTVLPSLAVLGKQLVSQCRRAGTTITVAESCTGGLVTASITSAPGASDILHEAFIVYSDVAKARALGISPRLLADKGAVSSDVAAAMAQGALQRSGANIAVAVTGVAGPSGGTEGKPVGLVFFATAAALGTIHTNSQQFSGDRDNIRAQSATFALRLLMDTATLL